MNTNRQVTDEKLAEFISLYTTYRFNKLYEMYGDYATTNPDNIRAEPGRKFIRVLVGSSVYLFIEKATGDIYKAASWKAPAKGVRGSIWNPNCDIGDGKPVDLFGGGLYKNRNKS